MYLPFLSHCKYVPILLLSVYWPHLFFLSFGLKINFSMQVAIKNKKQNKKTPKNTEVKKLPKQPRLLSKIYEYPK